MWDQKYIYYKLRYELGPVLRKFYFWMHFVHLGELSTKNKKTGGFIFWDAVYMLSSLLLNRVLLEFILNKRKELEVTSGFCVLLCDINREPIGRLFHTTTDNPACLPWTDRYKQFFSLNYWNYRNTYRKPGSGAKKFNYWSSMACDS